jgi:hypothetical protein
MKNYLKNEQMIIIGKEIFLFEFLIKIFIIKFTIFTIVLYVLESTNTYT